MSDLAMIGVQFDAAPAVQGASDLDKLTASAAKTEAATVSLGTKSTTTLVNTKTAIDGYSAASSNAAKAIDAHSSSVAKLTQSHGNATTAALELGHVFRSVFDEVQAGVPITSALSLESGRLFEVIGSGGLSGGLSALASRMSFLANPAVLATASIAGLGLAAYSAVSHVRNLHEEMDRATTGAGRFAGLSGAGLSDLATASASRTGVGLSDSRSNAEALAATGRYDAGNISGLMGLTRGVAGAYGLSDTEAGTKLADMFKAPTKALDELSERLGFLDDKTRQSVQSLVAQGDAQAAVRLATDAASTSLNELTKPLNFFDRASAAIARQNAEIDSQIDRALNGPSGRDAYTSASRSSDVQSAIERYVPNPFGSRIADDGTSNIAEDLRRGGQLRKMQQDDVVSNRQSLDAGSLVRSILPDLDRYQQMADRQKSLTDALANPSVLAKMGTTAGQAYDALDRLTTGLATFRTSAQSIIEQSMLSVAATQADTFAQKQLIDYTKTYITTLTQTHSAVEAAATATSRWNEAIASSNDAADKAAQRQKDADALLGLKPAQRLAAERDQAIENARTDGGVPAGVTSALGAGSVTPAMLAMFKTYVGAGYSPAAVAGYVGGTTTESGTDLNPTITNATGHYGVFQLDRNRHGMLTALAGPDASTQQAQYAYNLAELHSTESVAGRMLAGGNSVLDGVLASDATERPGDQAAMARRGLALSRGNALLATVEGNMMPSTMSAIASTGTQTGIDTANDHYSAQMSNLRQSPLTAAQDALQAKTAAQSILEASTSLNKYGASAATAAGKIAEMNERQALFNTYAQAGITPDADLTAKITAMAVAYGDAATKGAAFQDNMKKVTEALDSVRDATRNGLGTFVSDLEHGKSAGTAFRNVMEQIGEKVQTAGINAVTNSLLGGAGQPNSGGGKTAICITVEG